MIDYQVHEESSPVPKDLLVLENRDTPYCPASITEGETFIRRAYESHWVFSDSALFYYVNS